MDILRSNVHFVSLPVVSCRLVKNTSVTLVASSNSTLYKIPVDVCKSSVYVLWILGKCLCLPEDLAMSQINYKITIFTFLQRFMMVNNLS